MMWWNHGFWGWLVFAVMVVAMLACMAMMARMMMRHGTSWPRWETSDRGQEPREQILARRLASGEINVEKFQRLRASLQPASTAPGEAAQPGGAAQQRA